MSLLESIKANQNYKNTENGQLSLNTTNNYMLDLFSICGAIRDRKEAEILNMYRKALITNFDLAFKLPFYLRDIRKGLGERKVSRYLFKYLGNNYPDLIKINLFNIVEFGRYDDLLILLDAKVKDEVLSFISNQLKEDLNNLENNKPISLLGKWLPSINTSSKETRTYAKMIVKYLGISEKEYRKMLSKLREYLKVVERNLSFKTLNDINYSLVSSNAMNRYYRVFALKDHAHFNEYLDSLNKSETKVNASTLYPYNIVEKYLYGNEKDNQLLEAQWNALEDFVEKDKRYLVMADVSGSMYGRPLATSIGLAIYFAQRNKGLFHNHFMTFSMRPELVEIKGNSLKEKIDYIVKADWNMNTNLEAAFDLILNSAIKNNLSNDELPTSLVIITDMEFDYAVNDALFMDEMNKRFKENGYTMPNVVFWNVNARNNTFHADFNRPNVQLVSGQSSTTFETLSKGEFLTPIEYMNLVLNDARYDVVRFN